MVGHMKEMVRTHHPPKSSASQSSEEKDNQSNCSLKKFKEASRVFKCRSSSRRGRKSRSKSYTSLRKRKPHGVARSGMARNGFLLARERLESDGPHVLFVEKSAVERASWATSDSEERTGRKGKAVGVARREGDGDGDGEGEEAGVKCFRIPLDEDARVDVPKALETLGVPKIQFEFQPGVWRALKGYSATGKSIPKFRNEQQVHFRVGGSSATPTVMRGERAWMDEWLVEGDTEALYNTRVSRIVQKTHKGRIGVGTMVRVQSSLIPGLMLTCRHCVEMSERGGSINDKLYAFGGPVAVLYVSNKYDLALCKGPVDGNADHAFRLAEEGEEETGREVRMLSYPWHVDLVYGLLENVGPTQVHGHICMFSPERGDMPKEVDALATYMGGFPASSGGAVTLNSRVLCGIHVGVIWHDKDEFSMPLVLGSLESGSNNLERKDAQSGSDAKTDGKVKFHIKLCARKRSRFEGGDDENASDGSFRSQITRNYCSSSHGYLATYVSSTHIEEAFQDYIARIKESS